MVTGVHCELEHAAKQALNKDCDGEPTWSIKGLLVEVVVMPSQVADLSIWLPSQVPAMFGSPQPEIIQARM